MYEPNTCYLICLVVSLVILYNHEHNRSNHFVLYREVVFSLEVQTVLTMWENELLDIEVCHL